MDKKKIKNAIKEKCRFLFIVQIVDFVKIKSNGLGKLLYERKERNLESGELLGLAANPTHLLFWVSRNAFLLSQKTSVF